MDGRIIGINTETGPGTDYEVGDYICSGGATCLNIPIREFAEAAEQTYKSQKLPAICTMERETAPVGCGERYTD